MRRVLLWLLKLPACLPEPHTTFIAVVLCMFAAQGLVFVRESYTVLLQHPEAAKHVGHMLFYGGLAIWGPLATMRLSWARQERRQGASVRSALECFLGYLDKRTARFEKERSHVQVDLRDRGLYDGSLHATELADALIRYARDVRDNWLQHVNPSIQEFKSLTGTTKVTTASPALDNELRWARRRGLAQLTRQRSDTRERVQQNPIPGIDILGTFDAILEKPVHKRLFGGL